jgi:crossover junction endodeoxyribonuclease RuvC
MLVLGIDPGIAITGIALVSEDCGKVKCIQSSAITTKPGISLPYRLEMVFDEISKIIRSTKPDAAALESLFFNTNAKTALIVGQARGIVQLALTQNKIPITEYTPLQVKMALTGYGRADKNQIQQMVKMILSLPKILTPDDVADAAAIAITHCFSYKINKLKDNV